MTLSLVKTFLYFVVWLFIFRFFLADPLRERGLDIDMIFMIDFQDISIKYASSLLPVGVGRFIL
jgi:hypothetical protein